MLVVVDTAKTDVTPGFVLAWVGGGVFGSTTTVVGLRELLTPAAANEEVSPDISRAFELVFEELGDGAVNVVGHG